MLFLLVCIVNPVYFFKYNPMPSLFSREVVKHESYSYKADWWSVGCILYALLCGSLPFNAETKEKIQKNIKHAKLKFPDNIKISSEAKKFLKSLLNKDPQKRMSFPSMTFYSFYCINF